MTQMYKNGKDELNPCIELGLKCVQTSEGAFCENKPVTDGWASGFNVKKSDTSGYDSEGEKTFSSFEFGIAIALSIIGTIVLCMFVRSLIKYKRLG